MGEKRECGIAADVQLTTPPARNDEILHDIVEECLLACVMHEKEDTQPAEIVLLACLHEVVQHPGWRIPARETHLYMTSDDLAGLAGALGEQPVDEVGACLRYRTDGTVSAEKKPRFGNQPIF